jgi:hypothetical protein
VGRKDGTCDNFTLFDSRSTVPAGAERFYGAGEERAVLGLPQGYGYPIQANDSWLVTYRFMNHRHVSDKAYIQYRVTTTLPRRRPSSRTGSA